MEHGRALTNAGGGGALCVIAFWVVSSPLTDRIAPDTLVGTLALPDGACTVCPSCV